jgi:hypothetical protein
MTAITETRLPAPLRKMLEIASSDYWQPHDLDRLAAQRDHLPAAIDAARAMLEPAGPAVINKSVEFLAQLPAQAMNAADARMALHVYRVGLKDMPRDLLALACERAAATCEWRPSPAMLRKLVTAELGARKAALARLEAAARMVPPERQIEKAFVTPEEAKAILDQYWPDRGKVLAATPGLAVPVGAASAAAVAFAKGILGGDGE